MKCENFSKFLIFLVFLGSVSVLICHSDASDQKQNIETQPLSQYHVVFSPISLIFSPLNPEETKIKTELNSSPRVMEPKIILNPLESNYFVGEPIHFSGLINIPESKSLYVEFSRDKGTQKNLPEGIKIHYSEDIPVKKSDIAGYNGFSGNINTSYFLPGNYCMHVILLDEKGREIIVRNQTDTILTESLINNPERQSGNPILVTLFFAITAICLVTLKKK